MDTAFYEVSVFGNHALLWKSRVDHPHSFVKFFDNYQRFWDYDMHLWQEWECVVNYRQVCDIIKDCVNSRKLHLLYYQSAWPNLKQILCYESMIVGHESICKVIFPNSDYNLQICPFRNHATKLAWYNQTNSSNLDDNYLWLFAGKTIFSYKIGDQKWRKFQEMPAYISQYGIVQTV